MSETLDEADLSGFFRVMPENVAPLWKQLLPLVQAALATVSTHTPQDIRRAIVAMRAQLWVRMVDGVVVAAAVTEFIEYPVGLFLRVSLCGAVPDRKMEVQTLYETLDDWREAHGCIGWEIVGRAGWKKLFPEARIEGLVLRWVV